MSVGSASAAMLEFHVEGSSRKGSLDSAKLAGAKRSAGQGAIKTADPKKSTKMHVHVDDVGGLSGLAVNSTYATIHVTSVTKK
jgi:hypothetical protein